MNREHIRKEWREYYEKCDVLECEHIAEFFLSKLDEYADGRMEEVAKEVETKLPKEVTQRELDIMEYYADGLKYAASIIRSAMTDKKL